MSVEKSENWDEFRLILCEFSAETTPFFAVYRSHLCELERIYMSNDDRNWSLGVQNLHSEILVKMGGVINLSNCRQAIVSAKPPRVWE